MSDPHTQTGTRNRVSLYRLVRRFQVWRCDHAFYLKDLHKNPTMKSDESDRVSWKCAKCGHVFVSQCGLDISPKHGFILPNNKISNGGNAGQ